MCDRPVCQHCRRPNADRPRGLCGRCYYRKEVRQQYPSAVPSPAPGGLVCRHCHTKPVNRPRGLCWPCYYTDGVRDQYPSTSKYANRGVPNRTGKRPPADGPTTAAIGSPEKVAVLSQRAALGQSPWHPLDSVAKASNPPRVDPWPGCPVDRPRKSRYRPSGRAATGVDRRCNEHRPPSPLDAAILNVLAGHLLPLTADDVVAALAYRWPAAAVGESLGHLARWGRVWRPRNAADRWTAA